MVERGWVPDVAVRAGVRALLRGRLREIHAGDVEQASELGEAFISQMDTAPIALMPDAANRQHYEVPAPFYERVLGPHRKYSCCVWPDGVDRIEDAEREALHVTCERAGIAQGQRVLDLGCGWGSLSLWVAEHYPASRVVAVSNSHSQRDYVQAQARDRRLDNIEVITADMNGFAPEGVFDRVVSIEMFEHMRNWRMLFGRVHDWLRPGGRFFLHVFCHRSTPYPYVDRGSGDWMSRTFFSGGMMPSDDLAVRLQWPLRVVHRWRWKGGHYARTLEAWLAAFDAASAEIRPIVAQTYGERDAERWMIRWRLFFIACAELFAYRSGREWYVGHYLFERPTQIGPATGVRDPATT